MRALRGLIYVAAFIVMSISTLAQEPGTRTFQPPRRLFDRLFTVSDRARIRPASLSVRTTFRERPAPADCAECSPRIHLVVDSPLITDEFLRNHHAQANGGTYGDNMAVADFWYDAVHRRLFTRSLVLQEVDDPADLRLGRAPGQFPNRPDTNARLEPGTTVGHVGFVRWSDNGFGSYFSAMQGAVRDGSTGYLDLATVTGSIGRTRSGSTHSPEDLVKHVRLHPSGTLEVGFDTDPDARPDPMLLVRGNAHIEGSLTVDGAVLVSTPASTISCVVRTAVAASRSVTASCNAGEFASGGGGVCGSGEMRGSRPVAVADAPSGWELNCSRNGQQTAYVICCSR